MFLGIELSSYNIEKNSYIFSKESLPYISGNATLHFSVQAPKRKEIHSGKISYIPGNGNPKETSYLPKLSVL